MPILSPAPSRPPRSGTPAGVIAGARPRQGVSRWLLALWLLGAVSGYAAPPGDTDPAATDPLDQDIDWYSCRLPTASAQAALRFSLPADLPLTLSADTAELQTDRRQARLQGEVQLTQGDQQLRADDVRYDHDTSRLQASGDVLLLRPDLRLRATDIDYDLTSATGQATQVEYRLPPLRARGDARRIELRDDGQTALSDIRYTTCAPGNSDWVLSAEHLQLDPQRGLATVDQARLETFGVPVAVLPRLTFPVDGRRHSGWLLPTVGYGSARGLDLSAPYYLNLAPQYDATLIPRILSTRGLMLGGEFRYLSTRHRSTLAGEWLPRDLGDGQGGATRGYLALNSRFSLSPRWRGSLDLTQASDHRYFDDFGSGLSDANQRLLRRTGRLDYRHAAWQLTARADHFQVLDRTLTPDERPYSRLPQLIARYQGEFGPLRVDLDAEYVHFDRDTGTTGQRLNLAPSLALPWRRPWGFVTPRLSLPATAYALTDTLPGQPEHPDRLLPVTSLDSGLYLERDSRWLGSATRQTLEPRLHYLYVPTKDQDALPVFDTERTDLSYAGLFRDSRYTGPDRIGDAHQITLGVASRALRRSDGAELFRLGLGVVYPLRDQTVTLPGETATRRGETDWLGEAQAQLGSGWRTRLGLQWDETREDWERSVAQLDYRGSQQRLLHIAYRQQRDTPEQTDLGASWPLRPNLSAVGRWNYSLDDRRTLEALGGLEYRSCCWRFRTLARHYVTDSNASDLSLLFQFELLGLGQLGDDIDNVLERSIPGYRINDYELP